MVKNKHLPVLIVLLGFGLVGCAIAPVQVSHQSTALPFSHERVSSYLYLNSPKAEAINLKTGEKFHLANYGTNEQILKNYVVFWCGEVFKSECVLSRLNNFTYYKSLQDYQNKLAINGLSSEERLEFELIQNRKDTPDKDIDDLIKQTFETAEAIKEAKYAALQKALDKEQEEKQRLIASLTKRCEDYGFTGDNNIAACIQREAQHDKELEMQKWELEKTRLALQQAQSRTYVQQQPEEEEVPLLIQMLGDIAVGVAEGYKNQQIYQQPQQKQSIYRNCKPNC